MSALRLDKCNTNTIIIPIKSKPPFYCLTNISLNNKFSLLCPLEMKRIFFSHSTFISIQILFFFFLCNFQPVTPDPSPQTSPLGRPRSPPARASRMMIRERIRQGEKDALEAEERARVNQKVMSNKMEEMAQLQNTLISQNQVCLCVCG